MPGGRRTKLTPDLQMRFCQVINAGNYYVAACAHVGISYTNFREWMKRGAKQRRGKFREFRDAVKKAEADAEVRMVAQWQKHMPENWPAIRDFLGRRHPDRWADNRKEIAEIKKQIAQLEAVHVGRYRSPKTTP
jgi:transposase